MLPALRVMCMMESERVPAPGAPAVVDDDRLTGHSMAASSEASDAHIEVAAVDAVPAALLSAPAAVEGGVAAANVLAAVSR